MDIQNEIKRFADAILKMENSYEQYAKSLGTNKTGLDLIHTVYDKGECTQKYISEQLSIPKQTVNSIVAAYCKAGLIKLQEMPEDRRHKLISLTSKGEEYANKIIPHITDAEKESFEMLTEEEREIFLQLLEKFVNHLLVKM